MKIQDIKTHGFLKDILSTEEIHITLNHTFGAFYLPFFVDIKKRFIEYMEQDYHPDMFCKGIPELIISRIHGICVRTLIVEMSMYKAAGKLEGKDSSEEYLFFLEKYLGKKELREELFQVYPLLKENVWRTVEQSSVFLSTVWKRLLKDREEIEKTILKGKRMGKVVSISDMASDLHCCGQCVLKIETDLGQKFLYKPRPVQTEKVMLELLNYVYSEIRLEGYSYGCVLRDTYGWTAFVESDDCTELDQVKRYFKRVGAAISVCFILGTGDLHYENLIAHGEFPVPVDAEVLCTYAGGRDTQGGYSVLYSGILPDPARKSQINILNGGEGGKASMKVARVVHDKTSEMKIAYEYPELPCANNQVTLNGTRASAALYEDDIEEGFRETYVFLLKNKVSFLELIKRKCRGIRIRVLLENTQRYAVLLSGSGHPMVLQKPEKRRELLEHIYEGKARLSPKERKAAEYGIRDIEEGDIPYYYTCMDSHSLFSSRDEEIAEYTELTLMECLCNRLTELRMQDGSRQERIIRMAMQISGYGIADFVNGCSPIEITEGSSADNREWFYKKAMEIASQIEQEAVWDDNKQTVGWVEPLLVGIKEESIRLADGDMYFYNGMAGMAVFLYGIQQSCGRFKELCEGVKNSLFRYTDGCLTDRSRLLTENTGLFCGEASLCHAYQLLFEMTRDEVFLEYARRHSVLLRELLVKDSAYDLVYGNAGAVLTLCGMYSLTADNRYLEEAGKAADILISHAVKQKEGIGWINKASGSVLAGMSHGNSGMIPGLVKLDYLLGESKYQEAVMECLRYERSLYREECHNWADLRQEGPDKYKAYAWCHGLGGIAASRIASLPYAVNEVKMFLEEDLKRLEESFTHLQKRRGMCLCHGNMGLLLILDEYLKVRGNESLHEVRRILADSTLEALQKQRLMPQEKYAKGLMNGMAGIGYACLKLAGITVLPDIMLCKI